MQGQPQISWVARAGKVAEHTGDCGQGCDFWDLLSNVATNEGKKEGIDRSKGGCEISVIEMHWCKPANQNPGSE